MKFGGGRSLIASFGHGGRSYNLCAQYDLDLHDVSVVVVDGDYQIPSPTIIWSSGWIHVPTPSQDPTALAQKIVADLNVFLVHQFGPTPAPSWEEILCGLIFSISFFTDPNGVPQARLGP